MCLCVNIESGCWYQDTRYAGRARRYVSHEGGVVLMHSLIELIELFLLVQIDCAHDFSALYLIMQCGFNYF